MTSISTTEKPLYQSERRCHGNKDARRQKRADSVTTPPYLSGGFCSHHQARVWGAQQTTLGRRLGRGRGGGRGRGLGLGRLAVPGRVEVVRRVGGLAGGRRPVEETRELLRDVALPALVRRRRRQGLGGGRGGRGGGGGGAGGGRGLGRSSSRRRRRS